MKSPLRILLAALMLAGGAACANRTEPLTLAAGTEARALHQIFARWVKAEGGAAALKRAASYEAIMNVDFGGGAPRVLVHIWRTAEGRFRYETKMPDGRLLLACHDGENAWRSLDPLGCGLIPQAELGRMLQNDDMLAPVKVEENFPTRARLGDVTRAGRLCHRVKLVGRDGTEEIWFFDATTGHRVRIERAPWPEHPTGMSLDESDFRTVGDVTGPFRTLHTEAGKIVETTLLRLTFNPRMKADMFKAPLNRLREAQLLEKTLIQNGEAVGGRAVHAQVHSRVTHSTLSVAGVKSPMVISQKFPKKALIEIDVPGMGRTVQGYDGETAWMYSDMQGFRTLKGLELQQLLNNIDLGGEAHLRERCPFGKWLGERKIGDRVANAAELATWQGPAGTYYFDAENGRLLRIESTIIAGPKSVLPMTVDLSDFRTVDGITIPFMMTMTNPAMTIVTTIVSVQNNVPLDDALFAPRKDE